MVPSPKLRNGSPGELGGNCKKGRLTCRFLVACPLSRGLPPAQGHQSGAWWHSPREGPLVLAPRGTEVRGAEAVGARGAGAAGCG